MWCGSLAGSTAKLRGCLGLEGRVLTALDMGGFAALVELLTVYHLDNVGGYYPIEESRGVTYGEHD